MGDFSFGGVSDRITGLINFGTTRDAESARRALAVYSRAGIACMPPYLVSLFGDGTSASGGRGANWRAAQRLARLSSDRSSLSSVPGN
jgi:hypothetical protein